LASRSDDAKRALRIGLPSIVQPTVMAAHHGFRRPGTLKTLPSPFPRARGFPMLVSSVRPVRLQPVIKGALLEAIETTEPDVGDGPAAGQRR
jgi:hypothetical protein